MNGFFFTNGDDGPQTCLSLNRLFQTPFTLTLRIWDIYILEGERALPAMSYTILKLHKSKTFFHSAAAPC